MGDQINARAKWTQERLTYLDDLASNHFAALGELQDRACIYITGSMARGEAMQGSDLDLFVVDSLPKSADEKSYVEGLSYIETAHLLSTLDKVRQLGGFRPFSRGGEFLKTHSFAKFLTLLGDPQDDAENAFTARMLLLINSRPLLNPDKHSQMWDRVLDAYWAPMNPKADFRPIMLMNDIRRWWGVLCLNFERYFPQTPVDDYRAAAGAERRVANLKLRFARSMACYSTVLRLIHLSDPTGIVRRVDAERALKENPIDRVQAVEGDNALPRGAQQLATTVLHSYDTYLGVVAKPKEDLARFVSVDVNWRPVKQSAYEFHKSFSDLLRTVGAGKPLLDYALI